MVTLWGNAIVQTSHDVWMYTPNGISIMVTEALVSPATSSIAFDIVMLCVALCLFIVFDPVSRLPVLLRVVFVAGTVFWPTFAFSAFLFVRESQMFRVVVAPRKRS